MEGKPSFIQQPNLNQEENENTVATTNWHVTYFDIKLILINNTLHLIIEEETGKALANSL